MEQVWLGVLTLLVTVAGGYFGWLTLRERNNIDQLKSKVDNLELQRKAQDRTLESQGRLITDLQAQNSILRAEIKSMVRLLRRYEQAAHESLIVVDEEGKVLEWDAAATLMFGYIADEAIGKNVSSLIVPHELRQSHHVAIANVFKHKRQPRVVPLKAKALRRDNELIDVEIQLLPGWETGDGTGSWRYGARIKQLSLPSPEAKAAAEIVDTPGPVRRKEANPIVDS